MVQKKPLCGLGILVTRPVQQASVLCDLIKCNGGIPIPFPVIDIQPSLLTEPNLDTPFDLFAQNLIVFISVNAVFYGVPVIGKIPKGVKIAAIGTATRNALLSHGVAVDMVPLKKYSSEALLLMPEMINVKGQKIVIVRGVGGREYLRDRLIKRGAQVQYLEVYQRVMARVDPLPLLEIWNKEVHAVTVTSNECLENLTTILGKTGRSYLQTTPLFTFATHTFLLAEKLGIQKNIQANNASITALVYSIIQWISSRDCCNHNEHNE